MSKLPFSPVLPKVPLSPIKDAFYRGAGGDGGEMTQTLYAHMNKKIKNNLNIRKLSFHGFFFSI
jgi:hypothetical protein